MTHLPGIGRTALITGASSGIGRELALRFAADGYALIVCARRETELRRLADEAEAHYGTAVRIVARDLAAPDAAAALWRDLQSEGAAPIDALVNNAGFGAAGPFAEAGPETVQTMIRLNVAALTELTRCVLPGMLERRFGRILNLASMVAFQPGGPGMAEYYATKAYVLALTRGLARELAGSGIRVTALCPGPTRTEFARRAGATGQRAFRWLGQMDPAAVAAIGYRAMEFGRVVAVPGLVNKLLAVAGQLPPRRLALEVNRLLLR